ncbi:formimidoylglutamase [Macrococcus carouselicus]|uniref:Formimidoylglutamase n=1 Tax=Macrococcus carouselicus TaxID=69969 RepID=A0A9Q8FRA8_9STAP|nr:formimidoylglutamase [Macrococcus carouselicus]TDM04597.1 formimidoylglutamase [Macrococcus carouselicus]
MHQEADQTLWTGRLDSEDVPAHFRQFQTVKFSRQADVAWLGYAIDEGVRLNKGRMGAAAGPDAIRRAFAGLPARVDVSDYGNVVHDHDTLIETQREYAEIAAGLMKDSRLTLLVGGGHDIAYAQYMAMKQVYKKQKIGVINIDAHFDNREEVSPTSGTSFRYMLEEDDALRYFVLGIQEAGNTQALFDYAAANRTSYVLADHLEHVSEDVERQLHEFIRAHDVILFTICMDVIDSAYAPGVSASAVFGLTPQVVARLSQIVMQSGKVPSVSIAEVNPAYDADNRTAKLAAHLLYRIAQ